MLASGTKWACGMFKVFKVFFCLFSAVNTTAETFVRNQCNFHNVYEFCWMLSKLV